MKTKFIKENCIDCDNCIWGTQFGLILVTNRHYPLVPIGCGEINEQGGRYIHFEDLEECPKQ